MQVIEAVKIALPVFAAYKDSDWEVLGQALKNANIPHSLADKLLEFMPLAFGRVFLEGMNIQFETFYLRYDPATKREQRRKLNDEPVYTESHWAASEIVAANAAGEAFQAVVFRSSEVHAVNNALNGGSKPENLLMSPPVLMWKSEDENPKSDSESQVTKKRWQFWK